MKSISPPHHLISGILLACCLSHSIKRYPNGWLTGTLESAPRETQQHRLQLLQGEERAAAPVLLTASEWLGINIIIEGSERRTIEALLSSSGFDGVVGWIVGHGAEEGSQLSSSRNS